MGYLDDEKFLALVTSYRALVLALAHSGSLKSDAFESSCVLAIENSAAQGRTEASNVMAEFLERLVCDVREIEMGKPSGR